MNDKQVREVDELVSFNLTIDQLGCTWSWSLEESLRIKTKTTIIRSYESSKEDWRTISFKEANVLKIIKIKRSLWTIFKIKRPSWKSNEKFSRKWDEVTCTKIDSETKSISGYEDPAINEGWEKKRRIRIKKNREWEILRIYERVGWSRRSCKES